MIAIGLICKFKFVIGNKAYIDQLQAIYCAQTHSSPPLSTLFLPIEDSRLLFANMFSDKTFQQSDR